MAGNPIEDVQATPEEIAVVLSGELQKSSSSIGRIEN